ncbi:RsmE family RNA methyltransferase [Leptospira wolffii]|uniref:Ribosomal RNA small subunit methyltransferase E n=1 Tax=Leptospira wolffii TaxID=409998 RepID=A0ABV5BQ88_9LEPT
MNILLLGPEDRISSGEYRVSRKIALDHIFGILKKKEGDSLKAGFENESLGLFRILQSGPNELVGKYIPIIRTLKRTRGLKMLLAVQRPPTVEKILHLAGVWGLDSLEFLVADLSRREYLTSPVWRESLIREQIRLGMEQGANVHRPEIRILFSPPEKGKSSSGSSFQERILELPSSSFYLDPKGESLFSEKISHTIKSEPLKTVLLGPEAGWSPKEIELLKSSGMRGIRLSRAILRSEQAFAFFLSQWEALTSF